MTRWYTIRETARLLGLTEGAVRAQLCRHPKLFATPRYRRDGERLRLVRVLREDDTQMLIMLVMRASPWQRREE